MVEGIDKKFLFVVKREGTLQSITHSFNNTALAPLSFSLFQVSVVDRGERRAMIYSVEFFVQYLRNFQPELRKGTEPTFFDLWLRAQESLQILDWSS